MKTQRGISMIEVVVTIAIMGILMAAAMPSVGDWIRNSRVRNTAESIQNGLQQARMEAVRLNRPVTFSLVSNLTSGCTLSSSSGSWVVSQEAPTSHCHDTPSTTTSPMVVAKGAVADGGGATVSATNAADAAATSITFNGFGQIANASTATAIRRIAVTSADGTYPLQVEVSLGGIGRMCDTRVLANSGDTRACNNSVTN
ncbi:GspH/FimT family pseudopilin [Aquabacterium sp.]|uniref:GspH/FimT family pseudopilin n=1 Tax=Aquabacterium sp. TaxID=1872578 RepID=UPI002486FA4F|nr:GspH/FimT family pseudopilin [Aquabacterium sp.]MDI1260066.1 GspH/FimT family pseudopilin [Aquabacterium sp.]